MKKFYILNILAFLVLASCGNTLNKCSAEDQINLLHESTDYEESDDNVSSVYIIDSESSHRYHISRNCESIQNSSNPVRLVPIEDAQNIGKTKCGRCFKKPVEHVDNPISEKGYVFICTGPSSHHYHKNYNCSNLGNCSREIETVTIEEAELRGRKPCELCYE